MDYVDDDMMSVAIDALKKEAYFDWVDRDGTKKTDFEENIALAALFAAGVVFINNFWWKEKEGWSKEATECISINVNLSGVICWGFDDATTLKYSELEDLYEHWLKDPTYGSSVWYCKRIGLMPQPPIANAIRESGLWDIDSMGLKPNPTGSYKHLED